MLALPRRTITALISAGFVTPQRGPRNAYRFTFQDVVLLRTAHQLREAQLPQRRLLRSLTQLRAKLPDQMPMSGLRIKVIGNDVAVRDAAAGNWEVPERPAPDRLRARPPADGTAPLCNLFRLPRAPGHAPVGGPSGPIRPQPQSRQEDTTQPPRPPDPSPHPRSRPKPPSRRSHLPPGPGTDPRPHRRSDQPHRPALRPRPLPRRPGRLRQRPRSTGPRLTRHRRPALQPRHRPRRPAKRRRGAVSLRSLPGPRAAYSRRPLQRRPPARESRPSQAALRHYSAYRRLQR